MVHLKGRVNGSSCSQKLKIPQIKKKKEKFVKFPELLIKTFNITEKKFNPKMPPASASAVNNNNANAAANAKREERLKECLKEFILRERQRKKEEFEAKVEEERLRKEREARERQNDMTLEETRGQIVKLDQKLNELRDQKQQLFLQLKKVLNEDENRKKQQKDNELFAFQALQAQQANVPPQVFLPPVRVQHHQMPILPKPIGNPALKRGRSPSPPPHQGYYKNTTYNPPKPPTQYQNPGTLFYQTTSTAPQPPPDARGAIIYPSFSLPQRQSYHLELQPNPSIPVSKADVVGQQQKQTQVYHINLDQPPISQAGPGSSGPGGLQAQKSQVTMEKLNDRYHLEVKHDGGPPGHGGPPHQLQEGVVYAPLIPGMPLHPMQITTNPGPNQKGGASITQGYPRQQISVMQTQPGQQSHYSRFPKNYL